MSLFYFNEDGILKIVGQARNHLKKTINVIAAKAAISSLINIATADMTLPKIGSFRLGSRVHALHSYLSPITGRHIFIKRDDELSSNICGSKYRKFASLIPFLIKSKYDEIIAIGGSNSANIAGLLQLCAENQIPLKLFMLKSHTLHPKGNELLINLLKDNCTTIEIERGNWQNVNALAEEYVISQSGKKIFDQISQLI